MVRGGKEEGKKGKGREHTSCTPFEGICSLYQIGRLTRHELDF